MAMFNSVLFVQGLVLMPQLNITQLLGIVHDISSPTDTFQVLFQVMKRLIFSKHFWLPAGVSHTGENFRERFRHHFVWWTAESPKIFDR
jgi:hypothetical protein